MKPSIASITDKPIQTKSGDLLSVEHYAKAVSDFIVASDTPLIMGLQGEWGTGKTSLMFLVKELLDDQPVATAWVNTWEHSLFRSAEQTTPAVLQALLERLVNSLKSKKQWSVLDDSEELKDKVANAAKILGRFAARAAVNKLTGIDVDFSARTQESLVAEVADLKREIQGVIDSVVESAKNDIQKVVFFIDDLDRIEPGEAVEILEALKNIFDIDNCVFVLAIDYDVVVKGLEKKFGKKTDLNEREFRSFFDKIIQVPFTLPVGAYSVDRLLEESLGRLGVTLPKGSRAHYMKALIFTVGFNPRSVKRFINTYSLLKRINKTREASAKFNECEEFMLFALIGIQIAFPKIFRLLLKMPEYPNWAVEEANRLNVDLAEADRLLEKYGDDDLLDEPWERIIWAFAEGDAYLKVRMFDVLGILNLIRDVIGDGKLADSMTRTMEFASMTSVDDDLEGKTVVSRDYTKYRFEGEVYGKGRLVLAVVREYVRTRDGAVTIDELKEAFPDSLRSPHGVVAEFDQAKGRGAGQKRKRYFMAEKEVIPINGGKVVVCNQWGADNIGQFIGRARELGMQIDVTG